MPEAPTFLGRKCANSPTAASPFGLVSGKSALQAGITLLSRSCVTRGAGNIEFNAIIKPRCGFHSLKGGRDRAGRLCSARRSYWHFPASKAWGASDPGMGWMELGGFLSSLLGSELSSRKPMDLAQLKGREPGWAPQTMFLMVVDNPECAEVVFCVSGLPALPWFADVGCSTSLSSSEWEVKTTKHGWRRPGFHQPLAEALMFAAGFILLKLRLTFLCTWDLLFSGTFKLQISH